MWIAGTAVVVLVVPAVGWLLRVRRRLVVVDVDGNSMRPTLVAGTRVLVRRARVADVHVGQIVVIERPYRDQRGWTWPSGGKASGRSWMIKRVAALAGDPVPRAVAERLPSEPRSVVPPDHLVVLGDNESDSIDSRALGYVPGDQVIGVVLRRLRPVSR